MRPDAWGPHRLLLRRFFLARRVLPSLILPFAIGLIFTATYWVANGFALSGQQIADRELGRYAHATVVDVQPGDLAATDLERTTRVLQRAGVRDAALAVVSNNLRPDSLRATATPGPQRVFNFLQIANPVGSFPQRYALVTGRWPRAPGEVVLTPAVSSEIDATTFTVFDQRATFRVVGTYSDRFDTGATGMIAASGTWETIPVSAVKAFAPEAGVRVLWSGPSTAARVESLVRAALKLAPPPDGNRQATNRGALVQRSDESLSDQQRLLFAFPLAVLSGLVGIAVVRSNRRWTLAYVRRLHQVGLPRRQLGLVMTSVLVSGVVIAVAAGIAMGMLLGLTMRQLALPHVLTQPIGPARPLTPLFVAASVMTATTLLAAVVQSVGGSSRRVTDIAAVVPWALLRRVVAGVALLHGVQVASRTGVRFNDLGGPGVAITAAAVLLAPDVLLVLRLAVSQRRARSLLTRRMMEADRGGLALVSVVVAASLAFPIITNSYNATARRSNDALFTSTVRPGQLWVDRNAPDLGSPRRVPATIATALPRATPIELGIANASVYPVGTAPRESTGISTVRRASDLQKIFADEPAAGAMAAYVARGGVAIVEGPARQVISMGPRSPGPVALPGRAFTIDTTTYATPFAGVLLASAARKAGLTVKPSATIYSGLSPAQSAAAVAAVRNAGLDIRLLSVYTPPLRTKASPESYFALAGLLIVMSFLLIGLMRAVGERGRERSAQLLSVGFPRRWSLTVIALQLGLAVGAGLIAGVAGATAAVWIFAAAPAQAVLLSIPIAFVGWTAVLVLLMAAIGIATCLVSLRFRVETET